MSEIISKIVNTFDNLKKPLFSGSIALLYLSYFLLYFGVFYVDKAYINLLSQGIHLFVCLFLLIRFHPFRKHELNDFDSRIIFSSALILVTNLGITEYLKQFIQKTVKFSNVIQIIENKQD